MRDIIESFRPGDDVALLVDYENLVLTLEQSIGRGPSVVTLVQECQSRGRLSQARAYGNWTLPHLQSAPWALYRAGVEPVFAPTAKNSADFRLTIDAVDIAHRHPEVGAFVLVTGDGDLLHLVHFLRRTGKRVVVVSVALALSSSLAAAADEVLLYERGLLSLTAPYAGDRARPVPEFDLFQGWIESLLAESAPDKPATLAWIGNLLKERHGFDARESFGCSLKELVQHVARNGRVAIQSNGTVDWISLPNPDVTGDGLDVAAGEAFGSPLVNPSSFEALDAADGSRLIKFLRELERSSHYLTFTYVVSRIVDQGVLPQWERSHIAAVINDLADRGVLVRTSAGGIRPDAPEAVMPLLMFNAAHPLAREHLAIGRGATLAA